MLQLFIVKPLSHDNRNVLHEGDAISPLPDNQCVPYDTPSNVHSFHHARVSNPKYLYTNITF